MKILEKILTSIAIIILFSIIGTMLLFPQDEAIVKTLWQVFSAIVVAYFGIFLNLLL